MLQLNSKKGIVNGSQEVVYNFINDFRNFADLLPAEQLQDIKITGDTLEFSINGLGNVGLKINEKHPYEQLIIKAIDGSMADFTFWINLTALSEKSSQIDLTLQANLNLFIEMMAKAPLQQFINMIVEKMEGLEFHG
jgi:carbon monoxide dehydrogenase subunit G